MEYNVYMTNDCNLNCAYCSVLLDCQENHIPIKPKYELDELIDFIDSIQKKYHDNEVVVFFFGGEPSLEYAEVTRYAKRMKECLGNYELHLVLHTNGLLLNETPDELLQMLDLTMFSINYENIPHHQLAPSYFSRIYNNVIETKAKAPHLIIVARVTVTENTSMYTEIAQATPFFDMVYWQLENTPRFDDAQAFYDTYTFEVGLLFKAWFKEFKAGRMLPYIPFMAVIKFMFFHDRDDNLFLCGYDKHMLYVQTNGKCYACCDSMDSDTHFVGNIKDGVEFRGLKLTDFTCGNCDYRRICMGRCGRMHREFTTEHIDEYCRMNKFMFNLFIERKDEIAAILKEHPEYEGMLSSWQLDIMEYTP